MSIKQWWRNYRDRREYPYTTSRGVRYKVTPDGGREFDLRSLMEYKRVWGYLETGNRLPLNVPLDDLNRPIETFDGHSNDDEYLKRTGIID